jgi:hypothetical protein
LTQTRPIFHESREIAFGHLDPFFFSCLCGRIGRELSIEARFSNHVFTIGFDPAVHHKSQIVIRDSSGPRVFDPERYEMSLQLSDLIRSLPKCKVTQNPVERNYVYAAVFPAHSYYHAFFTLQKADKPSGDLKLHVESAYSKATPVPNYNPPRRIRFDALATKTYHKEQVRFGFR